MGFQENKRHHHEGAGGFLETEATKKWVVAGVPLRAPLKPIYTTATGEKESYKVVDGGDGDGEEWCSTTPTGEEAKIPTLLTCPPAPRKKKKKPSKCKYHNVNCAGVREFFSTPELETVFIRHVERAK